MGKSHRIRNAYITYKWWLTNWIRIPQEFPNIFVIRASACWYDAPAYDRLFRLSLSAVGTNRSGWATFARFFTKRGRIGQQWLAVPYFVCFHYFWNILYLLYIPFVFDRCHRKLDAVTPVVYHDCDFNNLRKIWVQSGILTARLVMKQFHIWRVNRIS